MSIRIFEEWLGSYQRVSEGSNADNVTREPRTGLVDDGFCDSTDASRRVDHYYNDTQPVWTSFTLSR